LPDVVKPRRVAKLETAGWERATDEAKQALSSVLDRLAGAGIEVGDRESDEDIASVEAEIVSAMPASRTIIAWEARWPLNTYARDMDASKLSQAARDRLHEAESMTQADYASALSQRERVRKVYGTLRGYDICISLAASGAAPIGLSSTGDPVFGAPSSLLGVPSLSLPLLQVEGLPLGVQVMGFADADAEMFAAAAGVLALLQP
jgi:Asp-tRNA(Asn)/Glu-tRNA(Gln) amidotransferase A subunit family amidase